MCLCVCEVPKKCVMFKVWMSVGVCSVWNAMQHWPGGCHKRNASQQQTDTTIVQTHFQKYQIVILFSFSLILLLFSILCHSSFSSFCSNLSHDPIVMETLSLPEFATKFSQFSAFVFLVYISLPPSHTPVPGIFPQLDLIGSFIISTKNWPSIFLSRFPLNIRLLFFFCVFFILFFKTKI